MVRLDVEATLQVLAGHVDPALLRIPRVQQQDIDWIIYNILNSAQ